VPYFFILPAFVLYVLAMSAALAVTWLYRPATGLRLVLLESKGRRPAGWIGAPVV